MCLPFPDLITRANPGQWKHMFIEWENAGVERYFQNVLFKLALLQMKAKRSRRLRWFFFQDHTARYWQGCWVLLFSPDWGGRCVGRESDLITFSWEKGWPVKPATDVLPLSPLLTPFLCGSLPTKPFFYILLCTRNNTFSLRFPDSKEWACEENKKNLLRLKCIQFNQLVFKNF